MLGSEWLYGAIGLLVGLHVLMMLYAYRKQGEPTSGATQLEPEPSPSVSDEGAGTVRCTHCGATNDRRYQFCRKCVADLSSGTARQQPDGQENAY